MIQLNLLPDVKLAYVKARRLRRTIVVISTIVAGSCVAFMVLLFITVQVVQTQHLNDLNKDIETKAKALQADPNLNKILTIQNQLNNLTSLHDQKPVVSRLFKYFEQVTPSKASISGITLDPATNTITVSGTADSVQTINQYVDTLKFTTYKTTANATGKAFSSVVLTSFALPTATAGSAGKASYSITFTYDPIIFDNKSSVQLVVPDQITTRSQTEKPEALFQTPAGGGQ